MSRVCVKQIPKYADEKRLKEHFGDAGEITDIKLLRTKDGRSRQLAFIGFSTEESATNAVNLYDRSFMGATPLQVEFARKIGEDGARPWSRYSKGSVLHQKTHPENYEVSHTSSKPSTRDAALSALLELATAKGIDTEDKDFKEFLAVMKARKSAKLWGNDDAHVENSETILERYQKRFDAKKGTEENANADSESHEDDDASTDSENYDDIPDDHSSAENDQIDQTNDSSDTESDHADSKDTVEDTKGSAVSSMEYLRSKMTKQSNSNEANSDDDNDSFFDDESPPEQDKIEEDDDDASIVSSNVDGSAVSGEPNTDKSRDLHHEDEEDVAEHGRIFVRNLPYAATESDVREYFSQYGAIAELHLPQDVSGRHKGFGYVTYIIPENAVDALTRADASIFQGRIIHVLPARPLESDRQHDNKSETSGNGFKDKRERDRKSKADSGAERTAWNALFVRNDTAIRAVAERLGVKESDILDKTSGNMAVRMALAETTVIKETRDFLSQEGVSLDAVERALGGENVSRSDSVILVKNLPYTADVSSLRILFGKFGPTLRVVLPPSRVIALVEYEMAKDAKRAFSSLSYVRFQRVPLYLEWAPMECFKNPFSDADADRAKAVASGDNQEGSSLAESTDENQKDVVQVKDQQDGTSKTLEQSNTLFVKNLNFASTEEALRAMFAEVAPLRAVRIPRRKNPRYQRGGEHTETLSMGFGFVEFEDRAGAVEAMKRLQHTRLDDHVLELKFSAKEIASSSSSATVRRKRTANARDAGASGNSAKLLVKNIAFEANAKDLRSLFGAFGQLKSLRVPKRFDGRARGFAFVEFVSQQEAANAVENLSSTHLYGRHLVIEWAGEEDSINELRDKAKQSHDKSQGESYVPKKKRSRKV